MDTQTSAGDALARSLATLLDLGRRAREARSEAELSFLLVNDSLALTPYRQAALWWHGRGVATLSGLVQADRNAPYVQWLDRLARTVTTTQPVEDAAAPRPLVAGDLPEAV
ncbi:MAG: secretion protein HylD, partial [Rubrivivax sp.]